MFEKWPDIVSVDLLCDMLCICKNTAYKLLKQNKIRSIKVGRSYRIPKVFIIDYVQRKRVDS